MLESIFDNATNVEPIETIEDVEVLDTETPITIETTNQVVPQVTQVEEVKPVTNTKTKDKIFTLQIILILAWVILTTLVYFFGYPLFEPFINV